MCYGGIDPKYLMRETQARLKGVAFARDVSEEPGQVQAGGPWARLVALFRRKQVEGSGRWRPSRN